MDTTDERLDNLIDEYLLARQQGEAAVLDRLIAAHPEYEDWLLAFAVLDAAVATEPSAQELSIARTAIAPALRSRALAAAFADDQRMPARSQPLAGLVARAQAIGLSGRDLAATVDLPRDLLLQLDRGLVTAGSVPRRCVERLAAALQTSADAVQAFLAGGSAQPAAAFHYAPAPPLPGEQSSFAAALAESGLATPEQRAFWQEALREDGLV